MQPRNKTFTVLLIQAGGTTRVTLGAKCPEDAKRRACKTAPRRKGKLQTAQLVEN